jgi:uncharacterized membrane protein HdeD (DUF308 family)
MTDQLKNSSSDSSDAPSPPARAARPAGIPALGIALLAAGLLLLCWENNNWKEVMSLGGPQQISSADVNVQAVHQRLLFIGWALCIVGGWRIVTSLSAKQK